jgi:hypothetical protein
MNRASKDRSRVRALIPLTSFPRKGERPSAPELACFTQPQIRWFHFTNKDGFRGRCIVKVQGRLLVDLEALYAWIDEQNENRGQAI